MVVERASCDGEMGVTLTAGLLEWLPQTRSGQWVGDRCYVTAGPRAASRLI